MKIVIENKGLLVMAKNKKQNKPIKKRGGGRPTKFCTAYIKQAFKVCAIGGFDNQKLARYFDTNTVTIYNWRKRHPEFFDAVKRGKDFYDLDVVERTLIKRALGYYYYECHKYQAMSKTGRIRTLRKKIKKHMAPDTTALIFYLANRQPDRWRRKPEEKLVHHDHTHTHTVKVKQLNEIPLESRKSYLQEGRSKSKQVQSKVIDTSVKKKRKKKRASN